jgi:membrane protease YdiL (CAAX protease family)
MLACAISPAEGQTPQGSQPLNPLSLQTIAQYLLMLFLVAVGPVWDYFDTKPLKGNPSSAARLGYYRRTILWLWTATAIAIWTTGWAGLFTLHGLGIRAAWLQTRSWAWWTLAALVTLFFLVQLVLPVVQVRLKYGNRPYLEPRQFESLRFFLPSTWAERRWFAALSVTAGFCEELLFRGFVLRELIVLPLHLGLAGPVILAAIAFASHHLYMGRAGFISTTVGGLVFTATLLVTGNLLACMILHALVDLSLLLYWRPRTLLGVETPRV